MKMVKKVKFPKVPGIDLSGVVDAIGANVTRFKPGDKVCSMIRVDDSGYAQFTAVPENLVSRMPENMSFEEAAGLPLAAMTALQSLRDKANIKPGMKVLVNGASGGVGMLGVQLARAFDCEVTAVCSGKNFEFVKQFNPHHIIDYQKEDFSSGSVKYDIVFDAVATSSWAKSKRVLKKGGSYVTTIPGPGIMLQQLTNFARGVKAFFILSKPGHKDLDFITHLAEQGKLKVVIEKAYSINEVVLAHERIETGRVRGKLVIKMDHS